MSVQDLVKKLEGLPLLDKSRDEMVKTAAELFAIASREQSHEGMMVSDYYYACYHYFYDHNLLKASQYITSCIGEASALNADAYLLKAHTINAMVNINYYKPFEAIDEISKASKLAKQLNDEMYIAVTTNIIGDVFTLLHDFSKANSYYQDAKFDFERSNYPADYIYHKSLFDYIYACIKLGRYDVLDSSINLGLMKFNGDPLILEYKTLGNILSLFKRIGYIERKITDDIYKLMFEIEDIHNEYDRFRILTLIYPLVDTTEDYQLFKEYTDLLDAYASKFIDMDIEDTIKLIKVNLLGVDDGNMEYIEFMEKKNKLVIESLDKAIERILSLNDTEDNLDTEIEKNKKLTKISQTDSLTHLYNRRYGVQQIEATLADITKKEYALIMLDVDNFKVINDTYGHGAGDSTLIEFSNEMNNVFDKDAYIVRLAGDEFVILLYNLPTDIKTRRSVVAYKLETLLKNLKSKKYDYLNGKAFGVSAGAVIESGSFEELYSKADSALYESKNSEKGTYTIYGEDRDEEDEDDDEDDE